MPFLFQQFSTSIFLLIFLFTVAGCGTGEKAVKEEYNKYKFDQQVIDKLPLYDSLASAIIENFPAFAKFIKSEDSYRSSRYIPDSQDPDVFIKLPPGAAPKVTPYYNLIGKEFIYGFDIFRDSSIKFLVRSRLSPESEVTIMESLSYYSGGNIRSRKFPEKDTALNKNWQYRVWFSKEGLF